MVANRTREIRLSGMKRGAWGNWPMVEMGTHLATERAGLVTLHLRDGAPQFLERPIRPRVLWGESPLSSIARF
jgi:hypothetical protein